MQPKLCVLTGTARSGGIGRGIARLFCRRGFHVMGLDIRPLQPSDDDGEEFMHAYQHHLVDVSNPSDINTVWPACQAAFPETSGIHCLIHNAAVADPTMPKDPQERQHHWKHVINVNLSGPFMLSEALVPLIVPGGCVLHISSTRALQSESNCEAYAASKAGLVGLTHAMAVSLAEKKVRVNAVLPGWIDDSNGVELKPEDHQFHPAGRVGKPQDVAELCLFLADEQRAGFVTGQQFVLDGGVTKKMVSGFVKCPLN
jgi:NAD(P)-dependent dehydrogenase (short-subunit alcohol dehydrogenase family)